MEEEKQQAEEKKEAAEEKKAAEQPKRIEEKKKPEEKKQKKTEAVVHGNDLPISTKHSMALCDFIRGRKIEEVLPLLEEVTWYKRAIPMKGEIPHRKGKMMSGRYPINATKQFIKLLKQLAANASVNGLDTDNASIEGKADRASRPYRRFGSTRFKRTNVLLKLKEINKQQKKNKKK